MRKFVVRFILKAPACFYVKVELKGATFETCEFGNISDVYCLKNFDAVAYMKFPQHDSQEWAEAILPQIAAMNAKHADEENIKELLHLAKSTANAGTENSATAAEERMVNGVNIHNLSALAQGPRSKLIYKFLLREIKFMDILALLNAVLAQPLIDASKGAVLNFVKVAISPVTGEVTMLESRSQDALFTKPVFATTKAQAGAVADMLNDSDAQIFLRATEILVSSSKEQVRHLESFCSAAKWSENISLAHYFNSVSTKTFFGHLKSYASGLQAMVRILNNNLLTDFRGHCEKTLQSAQSTMKEKIEAPRSRLKAYVVFLKGLIDVTPTSFPDLAEMGSIVNSLEAQDIEIDEMILSKMHFEKLLSIQQSFTVFASDPILQKIATMDRKFVKEGVLKKVCRKQNKSFMFWLFSDIIMYGTSLGNETFSFNRAMDLRQIVIAEHKSSSTPNAFEILGAEKSFVVIASSTEERNEWMETIKSTKDALSAASSVSTRAASSDAADVIAPIWVSDGKVDGCAVCQASFTFFNRRHHCRKCGDIVCAEHSKSKEILPHIHKTQKQRICDNCMKVKSNSRLSFRSEGGEISSKSHIGSSSSVATNGDQSHSAEGSAPGAPVSSNISSPTSPPRSEVLPGSSPTPSAVPPKKPPKQKAPTTPAKEGEKEKDLAEQCEKISIALVPPPLPSSPPPPLPTSMPPPLPTSAPPPLPPTSAPPLPPPPVPVPISSTKVLSSGQKELSEPDVSGLATSLDEEPLTVPPQRVPDMKDSAEHVTISPVDSASPMTSAPIHPSAPPVPPPNNKIAASLSSAPTPPTAHSELPEANIKASAASRVEADIVSAAPPPPAPLLASPPRPPPPPLVSSTKATDRIPFPVPPPPPPGAVAPTKGATAASPRLPPPPPPSSSSSSTPGAPPPPPPPLSTASETKPRPPPPPQTSTPIQAAEDTPGAEDPLKKYRKMKDMLPEGAVRQKMKSDGFNDSEITAFLAGKAISVPSAQELGDRQSELLSAPKPFVLSPSAPKPNEVNAPLPLPRRMSVLDEIKMGPKLKPVDPNDKRQKRKSRVKAIGLLGTLAAAMSERRINMKVEQDDDDSDASGWSDADSD